MKAKDLYTVWDAPDNSRLTSKQHSFRLPVHVAAKIDALCEIYPTKTRTQLVGDLLSAALDGVEQSFPRIKGKEVGPHPETEEMLYEDIGPASRYRKLANKHYIEMEKERGNKNPAPLYSATYCVSDDDLKAGAQ